MQATALDVAIVGGGPAGLATACAIRRRCPELRVRVFERAPAVQRKGAGLGMHPNGVAALTAIDADLAARIWSRACSTPIIAQRVDAEDSVLHEARLDWGANKPKQQILEYMLSWYSLTKTLFEDLPEGTVSFDHRLAGLQLPDRPSGGPVRLTFDINTTHSSHSSPSPVASTSSEPPGQVAGVHTVHSNHNSAAGSGEKGGLATSLTYSARVVLGCDGLLSPTRRLWMPDAEAPTFKGNVALRGRIPTQALRQLPAWSSGSSVGSSGAGRNGAVLSRSYASPAGKGHTAMVYPINDEETVWVIGVPVATAQERGVSYVPYGARQQVEGKRDDTEYRGALDDALKLVDLFAPSLKQVVEACEPGSCTINGAYYLPVHAVPEAEFGHGPVTLLGDAAHSMPISGQGANLALEDAAVVAYHLQRHGPCEAALRAYEADRAPRWRRIAQFIRDMLDRPKESAGAALMRRLQAEGKATDYEYVEEVHGFVHPCMTQSAPPGVRV